MANKTLNTVIKLRYDSYENWQANSTVVLQAGEAGICTIPADTGTGLNEPATLMKIGNGTSTWAELPWISGLAADVIPSLKGSNPTLPVESVTGLDDYLASHGAIDTDTQYQIVKEGDMGIKLQYKAKGAGAWTDGPTITLTPPVYTLVEGSANGTVAFNGKDVAVHGLGSAAYTASSAYDAAGAASAVQTALIGTAQDASSANTINAAKKFATESIDTAIGTLNLNAVTAGTGQVISQVQQTDGAVTAQVKTLTADDIPAIPQSKVTDLVTTLAGKQDTVSFDQEYNSTTNKAATVATVISSVNSAKTELIGTPDDASSLNTINAAKKYASEQIAAQIGSAYKAAGSTAFADLPTPEEAIEGYVYNVTDAFTADTKFITSEQSKQYPAGTNVVVVEVPGVEEAPSTYAYDVLTGMVDLSAYATTSAMNSAIGAAIQGLDSTASAEGSAVVSGVTLTDGVVSVASKTLGISDITDLTTTLAGKADTSSLGYFATGTDATHLTLDSGNYLILNGGGAAGF